MNAYDPGYFEPEYHEPPTNPFNRQEAWFKRLLEPGLQFSGLQTKDGLNPIYWVAEGARSDMDQGFVVGVYENVYHGALRGWEWGWRFDLVTWFDPTDKSGNDNGNGCHECSEEPGVHQLWCSYSEHADEPCTPSSDHFLATCIHCKQPIN